MVLARALDLLSPNWDNSPEKGGTTKPPVLHHPVTNWDQSELPLLLVKGDFSVHAVIPLRNVF